MMFKNTPIIIFILATIVASLHALFLNFDLYWMFWWSDMVTHFFGGLLVSITFLWLFSNKQRVVYSKTKMFILTIVTILIVSFLWEIFEFVTGSSFVAEEIYPIDTAIDLGMAVIGGILGYFYFISSNKKIDE